MMMEGIVTDFSAKVRGARRLGCFKVANEFLRIFNREYAAVMAQVVIYRALAANSRNETMYFAASEHFDLVHTGEAIPEYVAIISRRTYAPMDNGSLVVQFERITPPGPATYLSHFDNC